MDNHPRIQCRCGGLLVWSGELRRGALAQELQRTKEIVYRVGEEKIKGEENGPENWDEN